MGIDNLLPLLQSNTQAHQSWAFSEFANQNISVDISTVCYEKMRQARMEVVRATDFTISSYLDNRIVLHVWISKILDFTLLLLRNKIRPIFVFDGTPPPSKQATQDKRRELKLKQINRITDLQNSLDELREKCNEFGLANNRIANSIIKELKAALVNHTTISFEEMSVCKQVLAHLGQVVLQCTGEAEKLCVMLVLEKVCVATYSTDSDTLVHGCPFMLNKIQQTQGNFYFNGFNLQQVLNDLQLSYPSFVDFAILCGCDHNTNMPGIAVKRSLDLIKLRGNIENIAAVGYDISCLNHLHCRAIFSPQSSQSLIDDTCTDLLIEEQIIGRTFGKVSKYVYDFCVQYALNSYVDKFITEYKSLN